MEPSKELVMTTLTCPFEGCPWTYNSMFGVDQSFQLVTVHIQSVHATEHPQPSSSTAKAPKLNPPSIDTGVDSETWRVFQVMWGQYCQGSQLREDLKSLQLFQCASDNLKRLLIQSNPAITNCSPEFVMNSMEKLAVIPTSRGATREELRSMVQGNDESIRTFSARVKGKAQICGFQMKSSCQCNTRVDYTQEVVKDVILSGIADPDIKMRVHDVLDDEEIDQKSVNDIIALIERKEKALQASRGASVSALSSFKKSQRQAPDASGFRRQAPKQTEKVPCPSCKRPYRKFNGKNTKAFNVCYECHRKSSRSRTIASNTILGDTPNGKDDDAALLQTTDVVSDVCVLTQYESNNFSQDKTVMCSIAFRGHPRVDLFVCPIGRSHSVAVTGIADTGAQSNVWGLDDFLRSGFDKSDLQTSDLKIMAANQQPLPIIGKLQCIIRGNSPNGEQVSCNAVIYISDAVSGLFISFATMICLRIVSPRFPVVGQHNADDSAEGSGQILGAVSTSELNLELNSGCPTQPCKCPLRSTVPERPKALPFAPTASNIPMMKKWLLDFFKASTFNTCPHQPLQEMSGPPVEIHMDPNAKPKVCHTPAPIPLHWQQQVKEDIQRDEALGIIEKVPYGEPVTWCHRMVVTRKHNGNPRRTVDLSPLNRYCRRETYASESPFHMARRVPPNVWKTVCDAWNGYHSVPLRESDKHLTTFITPFGRYRYTRAPQGFLSSGDGYNRRFATILDGLQNLERCIDDTVFYDSDLERHWWQTIDFLIQVGKAGVVLNPEKFQFAQKEVSFAGFKISSERVEPLPKYLDAIRHFPKPCNSTDIRSWFGLVNQLASYAQLRNLLEPFRPFLSPKVKFHWDANLDRAFSKSKEAIVEAIKDGVQIFEIDKPVCLRPDWSNKGIGYVLLQKHCRCVSLLPDCCKNGWRVVLTGSRFLSATESRYAAIEGEALAIVYGLEQTRYFTQGCSNLLVVTDHKPLVKVFGDRTLDEITNTRLFRLKQRTLQWRFEIAYSPGKTNCAADATSRHPCAVPSESALSLDDLKEAVIVATMNTDAVKVTSIDWDTMASETQKDKELSQLQTAIESGFQGEFSNISSYLRHKDSLFIQDGVVMFQDRVIVPLSLRPVVLDSLHSAHQGVSAMQLRAQSIVFWPGMTQDIADKRNRCRECNRNAPSQPATPSQPADPPTCPFEQIFADYFDFGGNHYLVAGDRLSGFVEVFLTRSGSSHSGAQGLIKCLRKWFRTFGVPKQLSSDGGPEFSAGITAEFLRTWGVVHRISSAYHPQSNGRAEVAVKAVKRLMRSNLGPAGTLDTDRFLKAMLHLRNTPDPDCGISPAEIVFGKPLRDNLMFTDYLNRAQYSKRWQSAWRAKEEALRARFIRTSEKINRHARALPPLSLGDKCFIQNQTGQHANKWYHTGSVVEILPFSKYGVKMDGSGRITYRNRRFLKKYTPASMSMPKHFQNLKVPHYLDRAPLVTTPPCEETPIADNVVVNHDSQPEIPPLDALPVTSQVDATPESEVQPQDASPLTPSVTLRQKKEPLMLRRLRDHNAPGLREIVPP